MTPEERCAELRRLLCSTTLVEEGYPTVGHVKDRIGELVGRDIYTHELLFEDELCEEIRTGERPSEADIVMRMQLAAGPGKPVIVVDADTGDMRRVQ